MWSKEVIKNVIGFEDWIINNYKKYHMTKEQLEKYEKEIEKIYPDSFISEEEQNIIDPNYN